MMDLEEDHVNGPCTNVKYVTEDILNCSPTLSFSFENLYLEKLERSVQEDRNCETLETTSVSGPGGPLDGGVGGPGEQLSPVCCQSKEGNHAFKCSQKSLRLVEGRLQTVGFKMASPSSECWRNVVDSIFR
jgi:hypothetical protein